MALYRFGYDQRSDVVYVEASGLLPAVLQYVDERLQRIDRTRADEGRPPMDLGQRAEAGAMFQCPQVELVFHGQVLR